MEFITRSIARLGGRHSTGAGSPDKHLPKIAAHDAEAAITAALPPSTWDALPQDWAVVIDPADPHNIYYWNQQTDATTWHKPEHAAAETWNEPNKNLKNQFKKKLMLKRREKPKKTRKADAGERKSRTIS